MAVLDPRRIIIVWTTNGGSRSGPSAFDLAPKASAGQTTSKSRPEFSVYLGVNSGPYNHTTANGTVILPPIPIEWIVAPTNVASVGQCPSRAENLHLFGVTNAVVLALVLLTGCRPLMRLLTGGLLGAPGRWSAYWTWLVSFAMVVGSNAVVSKLIVDTEGYGHLRMMNVFALYSSRPRVNLVWLGLLRLWVGPVRVKGRARVDVGKRKVTVDVEGYDGGKREKKWWQRKGDATTSTGAVGEGEDRLNRNSWRRRLTREEMFSWALLKDRWLERKIAREINRRRVERYDVFMGDEDEWIYTDSYVATSISELFVQLVSAIFIGITWRRFPNEPIRDHMKDYYNYILAAPALALVGWAFIPIWWKRNRGSSKYNRSKSVDVAICLFWLGIPGFFSYGVAWRYWAEFLLLPGSLWCPPKLVEQAVIWSSFSGLSAFFGSVL